jgi:hypothetical protein
LERYVRPLAEDDAIPRSAHGLKLRDTLGLAAAVPLRSAFAWGAAVGLIAMVLFYAGSRAALYRDLPEARERVVQAFAHGDLKDANYAHGNTIIGSHQFNDCLILGLALNQPSSLARELSITPLIPAVPKAGDPEAGPDDHAPCVALRHLANGDSDVISPDYYHRYVHGQVVLTRYLLPLIGVAGMRDLYKNAQSAILISGFAIALVRLVRTGSGVFVGFALIFACFARWFGIGDFGQSLGHAPSDMVILIYLVLLCVGAGRAWLVKALPAAAAAFGALTMIMELLTGGLPLGVAVVVGTSAMVCPPNASPRDLIDITLRALIAFVAAAMTCLLLKLAVSVAVFGPTVLADYGHQLGVRMALTKEGDAPISGLLFLEKLIAGLSGLAEHSRLLAGGAIAVAIAAGAWGLGTVLRSHASPADRLRAILLALSTLAIVLWFPLFWQHTIEHAWFTERILVWLLVVGFSLFAEGLAAPARQQA